MPLDFTDLVPADDRKGGLSFDDLIPQKQAVSDAIPSPSTPQPSRTSAFDVTTAKQARIVDAAIRGAKEGWGPAQSAEVAAANAAADRDLPAPLAAVAKGVNWLYDNAGRPLKAGFRGLQEGIAQTGEEYGQPALGRDIAAGLEILPAMGGMVPGEMRARAPGVAPRPGSPGGPGRIEPTIGRPPGGPGTALVPVGPGGGPPEPPAPSPGAPALPAPRLGLPAPAAAEPPPGAPLALPPPSGEAPSPAPGGAPVEPTPEPPQPAPRRPSALDPAPASAPAESPPTKTAERPKVGTRVTFFNDEWGEAASGMLKGIRQDGTLVVDLGVGPYKFVSPNQVLGQRDAAEPPPLERPSTLSEENRQKFKDGPGGTVSPPPAPQAPSAAPKKDEEEKPRGPLDAPENVPAVGKQVTIDVGGAPTPATITSYDQFSPGEWTFTARTPDGQEITDGLGALRRDAKRPAPLQDAANGPWEPEGKNEAGETVYRNPQGQRAVDEGGVPYLAPAGGGDRWTVPTDTLIAPEPKPEPKAPAVETPKPEQAVAEQPKEEPQPTVEDHAKQIVDAFKRGGTKAANDAFGKIATGLTFAERQKLGQMARDGMTAAGWSGKPDQKAPRQDKKGAQSAPLNDEPKENDSTKPATSRGTENKRDQSENTEPPAAPVAESKPEIVEHTTKKGKPLRGVVQTDLTRDQAKAIDPYTFKVGDGFFIREKYLDQLPAAPPPKPERWKLIGKNRDGNPVYEDDNGVRSYTEGGIRSTESVQMTPRGPVVRPAAEKGTDYQVVDDVPTALEQQAQEQADAHQVAFQEAERQYEEWIAYHGTPHEFDAFDTARIGTGEGAQAYGHGLYFAENEGVAQSYQKNLTRGRFDSNNPADLARGDLEAANGDRAAAIKFLEESIQRQTDQAAISGLQARADALRTNSETKAPQGHLYTVRIKAKPEEMLDWDKPLSEQPEAVREFIKTNDPALWAAIEKGENLRDWLLANSADWAKWSFYNGKDGEGFYGWLAERLGSDKAASQALHEAGIKGIRYLDRSSRKEGEGTRNVVIFDHNDVEITQRNGEPVTPHAMTQAEATEAMADQEATSEARPQDDTGADAASGAAGGQPETAEGDARPVPQGGAARPEGDRDARRGDAGAPTLQELEDRLAKAKDDYDAAFPAWKKAQDDYAARRIDDAEFFKAGDLWGSISQTYDDAEFAVRNFRPDGWHGLSAEAYDELGPTKDVTSASVIFPDGTMFDEEPRTIARFLNYGADGPEAIRAMVENDGVVQVRLMADDAEEPGIDVSIPRTMTDEQADLVADYVAWRAPFTDRPVGISYKGDEFEAGSGAAFRAEVRNIESQGVMDFTAAAPPAPQPAPPVATQQAEEAPAAPARKLSEYQLSTMRRAVEDGSVLLLPNEPTYRLLTEAGYVVPIGDNRVAPTDAGKSAFYRVVAERNDKRPAMPAPEERLVAAQSANDAAYAAYDAFRQQPRPSGKGGKAYDEKLNALRESLRAAAERRIQAMMDAGYDPLTGKKLRDLDTVLDRLRAYMQATFEPDQIKFNSSIRDAANAFVAGASGEPMPHLRMQANQYAQQAHDATVMAAYEAGVAADPEAPPVAPTVSPLVEPPAREQPPEPVVEPTPEPEGLPRRAVSDKEMEALNNRVTSAQKRLDAAWKDPKTLPLRVAQLQAALDAAKAAVADVQSPPSKPAQGVWGRPVDGKSYSDRLGEWQRERETHADRVLQRQFEEGRAPVPDPDNAYAGMAWPDKPVIRGKDSSGNTWVGNGFAMVREDAEKGIPALAKRSEARKSVSKQLDVDPNKIDNVTNSRAATEPVTWLRVVENLADTEYVVGQTGDGRFVVAQKSLYDLAARAAGPEGKFFTAPGKIGKDSSAAPVYAKNAIGETVGVMMPFQREARVARMWATGNFDDAPLAPAPANVVAEIVPEPSRASSWMKPDGGVVLEGARVRVGADAGMRAFAGDEGFVTGIKRIEGQPEPRVIVRLDNGEQIDIAMSGLEVDPTQWLAGTPAERGDRSAGPIAEVPVLSAPAQDAPPSLGNSAQEVWSAWRDLPPPGGTYTITGTIIGGNAEYFFRDKKLYRSFPRNKKSMATYRDATGEEQDDVFNAIEAGQVQIFSHPPRGVSEPGRTRDMPGVVYHQATGRPFPGTPSEARLNALLAERRGGEPVAFSHAAPTGLPVGGFYAVDTNGQIMRGDKEPGEMSPRFSTPEKAAEFGERRERKAQPKTRPVDVAWQQYADENPNRLHVDEAMRVFQRDSFIRGYKSRVDGAENAKFGALPGRTDSERAAMLLKTLGKRGSRLNIQDFLAGRDAGGTAYAAPAPLVPKRPG